MGGWSMGRPLQKEFDVVTAMDMCVDFLVDMGDTEPEFGQTEKLIRGYNMEMGGSACIFASQCARLGLRTTGPGAVGNDIMSEIVLNGLKASGVNTAYVRTNQMLKTGLGLGLNKCDGNRSILTYMGAIDTVEKEWLEELLPKTRHLHICSYYLLKKLRTSYPDIIKQAKRDGISISLDTNWDPDERWDGIWDILPDVDIFFPNENEVRYISGESDLVNAISRVAEMAPILAVKRGARGAIAYDHGEKFESEALNVSVADTVGAGDSFDGGFVYGFLDGLPVEHCLRIGTACGSLSTRKSGGRAGQPDLSEIKRYL